MWCNIWELWLIFLNWVTWVLQYYLKMLTNSLVFTWKKKWGSRFEINDYVIELKCTCVKEVSWCLQKLDLPNQPNVIWTAESFHLNYIEMIIFYCFESSDASRNERLMLQHSMQVLSLVLISEQILNYVQNVKETATLNITDGFQIRASLPQSWITLIAIIIRRYMRYGFGISANITVPQNDLFATRIAQ